MTRNHHKEDATMTTDPARTTAAKKGGGCIGLLFIVVVVAVVALIQHNSHQSPAQAAAASASAVGQMKTADKLTADKFAATMGAVQVEVGLLANGSATVQDVSDAVAQAKPQIDGLHSTMAGWPQGDGTQAWTASGDAQRALSDLSAFLDTKAPSKASAFKADWAQMAADWNPVAAKYWPADVMSAQV